MTDSERAPKSIRLFVLWLPPVLIASMSALFVVLARLLGPDAGCVVGFAIYWASCLSIPTALLGPARAYSLMRPSALVGRARILPAAVIVLVMAGTLAMYAPAALRAPAALVFVAVPVGMLNGVCEELLY